MEAIRRTRSEPPSDTAAGGDVFIADYWGEALRHVAKHYNLPRSSQSALQAAAWTGSAPAKERIRGLARELGLRVVFSSPERSALTSWHTPFLLQMRSGLVGVVTSLGESGEAAITFAGEQRLEQTLTLDFLLRHTERVAIARPERSVPDARVDAYVRPFEENWLRRIVLADVKPYFHVMLASLVANTLGLAGVLFSMQVYDRVVPAESLPTLYVLFSGVLLALAFDFVLRRLRLGIVDLLGKRADMRISDQVFGHALRVKNRARPLSTGSFIAQLRDLEQVRELLTSTTVTALVDIPFFLLFLAIFWYIAGALVLVPLCGLVALLTPGLLAQRRLRAHSIDARREASMRNAMLVEAVQGLEDIKTLQAEGRFQQQWNHLNATTSSAQLKQRSLTNALGVWTHNVQTAVYAVTVLVGAPMVIAGDITTGALVGASILGSRIMAPLAQLSQILGRLQQAKVAMQSLNQLMQMPVDHPLDEARIHCPSITGRYSLKSAVFRYADEASPTALMVRELQLRPGEKIGLLGRNGAGKSTLLQALSGLLEASSGEVLLDDIALQHIDPADVRRDVGFLSQNARLFYGTIRENLTIGAPHAADEEILAALAMVRALDFIRKLPKGLDHLIQEGGGGLSGGQRQSLLLARLVIRQPSVVLLDEPTAAMDEASERHFISQFLKWSGNRTVVIATHRMRVLELVDRLIVVENGQIALDDSKENALRKLRGLSPVAAAGASRPAPERQPAAPVQA